MKIRIETDNGKAGTKKELNWGWLDRLVTWYITRNIMRTADSDLQLKDPDGDSEVSTNAPQRGSDKP